MEGGRDLVLVLRGRTLLAHLSVCLTPCQSRAATDKHPRGLTLRPPPPPPRSAVWCERPSRAPRVPCAPAGALHALRFDASCGATQLL